MRQRASRESFTRHIREALRNLYDPAHIENQPLIGLLGVQPNAGGTEGEALCELLRATIEKLKPAPSLPADRPEWLPYRVLWLRYVRCVSQQETCCELGISDATFFRYQKQALEAVANMLWEQHTRAETAADLAPEQALERSIELAARGAGEWVHLGRLLAGVIRLVQPLAAQQAVKIRSEIPLSLPQCRGDPSLLRQIFVNALAEAIAHSPGHALQVSLQQAGNEILCRLHGLDGSIPPAQLLALKGFSLSRELVGLYHGRLWSEGGPEGATVLIALPATEIHRLLVIDDDPHALELYRRYLHDYPCALTGARTLEQTQQAVAGSPPDLVLLDVIMPQTDGWAILRYLRETPLTAGIPIIVCSVIDQPQLALALGATAVLTKPFTPADLLQALAQSLAQPGSGARAHRAAHSPA